MFYICCLIAFESCESLKKQKKYSHFKNLNDLKVAKFHDLAG